MLRHMRPPFVLASRSSLAVEIVPERPFLMLGLSKIKCNHDSFGVKGSMSRAITAHAGAGENFVKLSTDKG